MQTFSLILLILFKVACVSAQTGSDLLESAKKKYRNGDISGAIADYSTLLKINPKSEEAYYERGRLYNEQKKYIEAIRDFSKAVELNPRSHRAYYLRGYTKYLTGSYPGAESDLTLSIEIYPNSALAYWYRAEAKIKTGNKTGACEDWDKAYRLGYFEASQKIQTHCKGVQLSSEVSADEYLKKGDIQLDKGDASGALEEYMKAYEMEPNSAMINYSIGLAKFVLKDKTGACMAWRKAAEAGSVDAKQMMNQHCN